MHQRVRAGADGDAVRLQRAQVLGRYVLVIEGDHVAALGELAQRVEVAIVADDVVGDDLGGRDVVGLDQDTEVQTPTRRPAPSCGPAARRR